MSKLQGTCSVCLRPMQLRGVHPIRHGFSAVGVRHGQSGGYHTGPCSGTSFPHLGISTEGTVWALERERRVLDRTNQALAELATNPPITWYPKKYKGGHHLPDISKPRVVKYGDPNDYTVGSPSYEHLHRSEKSKIENQQQMAERAIAEYEKVIASWSPSKYPATGAPEKLDVIHMERQTKNIRGETVVGTLCRSARRGRTTFLAKTNDPAKVTCKRCRAALGLPAL